VSTPWKTGTTEEAQVAGRIKREKLQCSMGSCIGFWNADRKIDKFIIRSLLC
jgi:hypothetical protein